MTMRRARFTNIRGSMHEFASDNLIFNVRPREARSQKSQLKSGYRPGSRKDVKIPIKHKMT